MLDKIIETVFSAFAYNTQRVNNLVGVTLSGAKSVLPIVPQVASIKGLILGHVQEALILEPEMFTVVEYTGSRNSPSFADTIG